MHVDVDVDVDGDDDEEHSVRSDMGPWGPEPPSGQGSQRPDPVTNTQNPISWLC